MTRRRASAKPPAVLDTSFWTIGFRVGVLGYALAAFDIEVPAAVAAEILAPDVRYPTRLYPGAALFEQLRSQLRPAAQPEPPPLALYGPGEAAAIAVAHARRGALLLINDRRPAEHARNLGIPVLSVPGMVALARARGLVSDHLGRALLASCVRHGTSPAIVSTATRLLDALR